MQLFNRSKPDASEDVVIKDNAGPWSTFWSLSSVEIAGQVWDLASNWRGTRRWGAIFACLPFLLVAATGLVLVGVGKLNDARDLANWYANLADQEIKLSTDKSKEEKEAEKQANSDDSQAELQERSNYIDLVFRRVLQLNQSNKRAMFHVAAQMARYGKTAVARKIMEGLAPPSHSGFELAHTWLAGDMFERSQKGEVVDVEVLKHHLKIATLDENVSPMLLVVYSHLLQRDEQISEAEQVLRRAAKFDPQLLLNSILIYNRNGLTNQAKAAADLLVETVKEKLTGKEAEENAILTARAYVLTNRIDDGINVLQSAFVGNQKSMRLRRALSDGYRIKFRASSTRLDSQVRVNLDFLNAAIVYDPTNIAIQEELNFVSSLSEQDMEKAINALRAQIAMAGTSYAARLLVAQACFRQNQIDKAVNEYEIVLAELPGMTLVINNLAMMYTMLEPKRLAEALLLIDRAIAISPSFAEFHDTRGEILVAMNRGPEAIAEYQSALESEPERLKTREKLATLLELSGQPEQAAQQRAKLEEVQSAIQKRLEAAQAGQQAKQPPTTSNPPTVEALPDAAPSTEPTPTAEAPPAPPPAGEVPTTEAPKAEAPAATDQPTTPE